MGSDTKYPAFFIAVSPLKGVTMKRQENEFKILESSIIPIYEGKCITGGGEHEQLVNARELHGWLEVGRDFTTWIKDKIEKYGYLDGHDFSPVLVKSSVGRPATEYIFRLDVAKEIAMVENNDKGRMVRRYFIEAEKRYQNLKLIHARSKAERRLFTDVLKEVLPESPNKKWAYKYYTDLVYKIVTGKNAKQLRELYGLSQDDSVRDKLNPQELREDINFERIIESLLELGHNYDNIKDFISKSAIQTISPG